MSAQLSECLLFPFRGTWSCRRRSACGEESPLAASLAVPESGAVGEAAGRGSAAFRGVVAKSGPGQGAAAATANCGQRGRSPAKRHHRVAPVHSP